MTQVTQQTTTTTREIWKPFPKQEEALRRSEFEVLFGGARGPGKTDAGLVWLTDYVKHPRHRALILRKNTEDLSDWLDRAEHMYKALGARVTRHPTPLIVFPSGAKFRIGHLKDPRSYEKYLGHEYQKLLIEELTQIPKEEYYIRILGSCRSTIDGLKAQVFCTTNPGSVGHLWVKRRFVDPAPWGTPFIAKDTGRSRIFISATVDDNPILMEKDPNYVIFLDALKESDPDLWKAWRHGDWDVFAGQFFGEFSRNTHVIRPFTPKKELPKVGALDWGFTNPFYMCSAVVREVHWTDPETFDEYVFNRVYIFDELTGTKTAPKDVGKLIDKRRSISQYTNIWGDPAIFNKSQDGTVIADSIQQTWDEKQKHNIILRPSSNDRINGWGVVRNWLSMAPDGKPYCVIAANCNYLIDTLPAMVHDDVKVEDIDTAGDDHPSDTLRYLLVKVKWIDISSALANRPKGGDKKYHQFTDSVNLDDFTVKSKDKDWRSL